MKKIILPALGYFLLALPIHAQSFEEVMARSLGHFKAGDTEAFERTYTRLFPEFLKANVPSYIEACRAAANGEEEAAVNYLRELIDEDLLLDEIASDPNFDILHNSPHWEMLLQAIDEKTSGYNNPLRLQLQDVQYRDQGIRILYIYTDDEESREPLHQYMKTVDLETAALVCDILDDYGWLGSDKIGMEGNKTLFLAIQHVDDIRVQGHYLPMLEEAVSNGDAEGWHYAFLTDRILMNQGRRQIYGTQKIVSDDPAKTYIIPLEYPEKVDELRTELGMDTLAEDLMEEGMEWDLQKYLERLPDIERMYKERWESLQNNKI